MPTTIQNTLKLYTDVWSDPGDYPSNAGAGPLPSRPYVDSIEGEIEIQLGTFDVGDAADSGVDLKDPAQFTEYFHDYLRDETSHLDGVVVQIWTLTWKPGWRVVAEAGKFDASGWEPCEPEPEHEEC